MKKIFLFLALYPGISVNTNILQWVMTEPNDGLKLKDCCGA